MVDEVALSVVLYTLGSPAAVLLAGGGGGRTKPGVGAGAGGRRGGWWRGHRSQAPSQGGQTMMGDSGREHVRCGKADWGEKRERRIIPGPQTRNGNRERNGQSREVVSWPMSPTTACSTQRPSRQAQISLGPHPSPPTAGATEPRACGGKGYSQARSPRESRSLRDAGATPPRSQPSMPRRALRFTNALCPSRARAGPGPSKSRRASKRGGRLSTHASVHAPTLGRELTGVLEG